MAVNYSVSYFLVVAVILLLATFSNKFSTKFGVPGLIIFLGIGILFGSDGLNVIYLDDPAFAQQIAILALIIILFEGGFHTRWNSFRTVLRPALSLSTLGVTITAVVVAFLAHYLLGLDPAYAFLLGAILSSTDAAAVFSILRDRKIDTRTATTLEVESGSNDPMAIVLTLAAIQYLQGNSAGIHIFFFDLLWQLILGGLLGVLIGRLSIYLINHIRLDSAGFYPVLALGISFFGYGFAETLNANGFLTVYIVGIVLGNANFSYKQGVFRFLGGLTSFMQILMFIILGLLVFPNEVSEVAISGLVIGAGLTLIARPLAVFVSTAFAGYTFKQRIFISWAGLKGAVPIILATYPLVAGIPGSNFIFNMVFFVVLVSALIQGLTIPLAARVLGLETGIQKKTKHTLEIVSLEKPDVDIFEIIAPKEIHGKRVASLSVPEHTLITAIIRDDEIIAPRGDTIIQSDDILFILSPLETRKEVLRTFGDEEI